MVATYGGLFLLRFLLPLQKKKKKMKFLSISLSLSLSVPLSLSLPLPLPLPYFQGAGRCNNVNNGRRGIVK
jgi:hypothetical protein